MAYKNIEDRRAYHKQYMKERREWYAAHHWCTECGKEDARTMIGKRICFDCYEKKAGHPPIINIEPKKKKEWIPKHGIPKSEYYENGLCTICGQHSHLDNKRLCQKCYESVCKAAWLGRKAQGVRAVSPPTCNTEKAKAAYQYCLDHRQEYIERWKAEYDCEYEERASAKEQRKG